MKNHSFRVSILCMLFALMVSGCRQQSLPEPQFSEANMKALQNMVEALQKAPVNYSGVYRKYHEYHGWEGHSGASDYYENDTITITVENGMIINYTRHHVQQGAPITQRDYVQFYVPSQETLCTRETISTSVCASPYADSRVLYALLSLPDLTKPLKGCRTNDYYSCPCGDKQIPLDENGISCPEEFQVDRAEAKYVNGIPTYAVHGIEVTFDNNGVLVYYPETGKGYCYLYMRRAPTEEFANGEIVGVVECREVVPLTPFVPGSTQPLKNITCIGLTGDCSCTFDPVEAVTCTYTIENLNFDSEMKKQILSQLGEFTYGESKASSFALSQEIEASSLSQNQSDDGITCYSFFAYNLQQQFCIDAEDLIIEALWGTNLSGERYTHINITKIERVSFP